MIRRNVEKDWLFLYAFVNNCIMGLVFAEKRLSLCDRCFGDIV